MESDTSLVLVFIPCEATFEMAPFDIPSPGFWQTLSFGDYLYFRKLPTSASKDRFECNMADVPTDGSNLVLKALELFRQRTSTGDFYEVRTHVPSITTTKFIENSIARTPCLSGLE